MTIREFYVAVMQDANVAEEVAAKAKELLEALDNKNTNAANARKKKKAEENAPIIKAIMDYLTGHVEGACSAEIADNVEGVGTPKISSVCRTLATDGILNVDEVKYPGNSRKVKVYSITTTSPVPTEPDEAEEDTTEEEEA